MIDAFEGLKKGDMITLDSDEIFAFTGIEDFTISRVDIYESDEAEITIIEMKEEIYLIGHTMSGSPRYFVCESYDRTINIELDEDFPDEIQISSNGPITFYQDESLCITDEEENTFCEYHAENEELDRLIIAKNGDLQAYLGFEIDEYDIVL